MSTSKEPEEEWSKEVTDELWELIPPDFNYKNVDRKTLYNWLRSRLEVVVSQAKSQGAREALEMAVSRLEDSLWQCPTHGVPELGEMGDGCLECNEAMDVNVTYYDAIKTVKLLQSNLKEKI